MADSLLPCACFFGAKHGHIAVKQKPMRPCFVAVSWRSDEADFRFVHGRAEGVGIDVLVQGQRR